MVTAAAAVAVRDLVVRYGRRPVLKGISFSAPRHQILAFIGPAQSGKSSLLRVLNRTIDFIPGAAFSGEVRVLGRDVHAIRDPHALRRDVGMVLPLPVALPMTIYDNVAFAPRLAGVRARSELDGRVERCLRQAALWDEVKDRLRDLGTHLSGGQQQRLSLARALSHHPSVLCLDEFSIAIDPVTTMRIEEVLRELSREITILLVTNLTAQARRLADRTIFLLNGEIVEDGPSAAVFSDSPQDRRTYDYINGTFG